MSLFAAIGIFFVPALILIAVLLVCVKSLSVWHVFIAFFSGILAIVPIAVIQLVVLQVPGFTTNTILSVVVTALVFNGLIEETIKMVALFLLPGKKMTLAAFMAAAIIAGFALGTFESVIYLINGEKQVSLRFFTAVLLHTFCSGLSGLYVWTFKNGKGELRWFVLAVLLHGVYNFFAGFSGAYVWFSVVTVLYAAIRLRFAYTSNLTDSKTDGIIPSNNDAG